MGIMRFNYTITEDEEKILTGETRQERWERVRREAIARDLQGGTFKIAPEPAAPRKEEGEEAAA